MAKVSASDSLRPVEMVTETEKMGSASDSIHMKKQLGLLDGIAIIVGIIVGSGIFLSPGMTLNDAGSPGMALVVWVSCGCLTTIGALCYAELGTMIPKSGGDYAYIVEAYGELPGFLYLWGALMIMVPAGNAITAVTFAKYILAPVWSDCEVPLPATKLFAALITCLLTVLNCYNVKWVTRVQSVFTASKILALAIIIAVSFYYLGIGKSENLKDVWKGPDIQLDAVATAFYYGLFSYSGWNFLNFVTEELKDPIKNLPRAIYISLPLVTCIYTITNVAYFIVLPADVIKAKQDTIAFEFGNAVLGVMSWVMPVFVALTTFGSLNGAIYASSRLYFVGARNGHLPLALALIDIKRLTPVPSLIFMCIITLLMLVVENTNSLIVFTMFPEALFTFMSVTGLLYMRWSKPDLHRPIKVNIVLPILYSIICLFLLLFPFSEKTMEMSAAAGLTFLGVPVFLLTIKYKNKPQCFVTAYNSFNLWCSKMFMCLPESSKDLSDVKDL